ncbi:MAG: flagellar hook-length control protein FliK, partial [Candidatus Hydrogenedentes bacterium]|nr:flagellar hook-length control protein FliK [Candidatus Hydrogenedentota bacterium]
QLNGTRIPLPNTVTWPLGQVVDVLVSRRGAATELRLSPQPETGSPQPVPKSPSVEQTIQALLNKQGTQPSANLVRLLSAAGGQIPMTVDTIGALVRLFAGRARTAGDQSRFDRIVEELVAAGVFTGDDGDVMARALESFFVRTAATLVSMLKRLRARAGNPVEAQLAKVAQGEQSIEAALRNSDQTAQTLRNIRQHEEVVRFLRETGHWEEFRAATDRVLDRMVATHIQNTAGLEQPYVFVDLPFALEGFIDSAHIHFWIEEGDGKSTDPEEDAVVALDLRMTRLGDLWISLRIHQDHCSCRVLATSEEIVEALRAASGELEQILNGLGFSGAEVEVGYWDGDRIRETADFMRPLSRLDLTV